MPTYDYRCKECGHELEVRQSFTDDALTRCPECGADALRKRFGAVGISFKGSGFYKTDSRSSSSSTSPAAASASSDSGTSDGGTSGGADKKTDKGADKGTAAAVA